MAINSADQPLEALREKTIDQLIMNYGHGKLSLEAFERRLEQALDAKDHSFLTELSSDLDLTVDASYIEQKKVELGFESTDINEEDPEYSINIFSGTTRSGNQEAARETRMINIFGGGKLDFSEAKFTTNKIKVKNFCLFGGADIVVPEYVNVITKGFCIFGGINNRSSSSGQPKTVSIIIENFILFGGATIRIKRSMKDKLMEFGANVRSVFGKEE